MENNKTVYKVFKENGCIRKIEYEIIDSNDTTVVLKLKSPIQTNDLFKDFEIVAKSAILEELNESTAKYLSDNYMMDYGSTFIEYQRKMYPIEYIYTYKANLEDDGNEER